MSTPVITHNFTIDGLELFSKAVWPDGRTLLSFVQWGCPADGRRHVDDAKAEFDQRITVERQGTTSSVRRMHAPGGPVDLAVLSGLAFVLVPRLRVASGQVQVRWLRTAAAMRRPAGR